MTRRGRKGQGHESYATFQEVVSLAPDIIGAILKGTHPLMLTLCMRHRGIPDNWNDQRELYGFETSARA